jgi:hypothetical protein
MKLTDKLERAMYSFIIGCLLGTTLGAVVMAICVRMTILERCLL